MSFEIIVTDMAPLMLGKARALRDILEGRSSMADVHRKNVFLRNVREWSEIDMRQITSHFGEEDDLCGGVIVL